MAGSGVAADLLVHVGADVKDAINGLNTVDQKVKSGGANFGKAGLVMGGASLAIVGGLGAAINSAADFEASISQITALGGDYAAQQEQISALALKIGQDTSFSATEGALAIAELAKAGVPVADILAGAASQAASLAEAGGVAIPEAATIMSNAMNIFGIAGSDAAMVADSFAAAANASSADVNDLAMAMSQGGLVASSWGLSLNDTNTALAAFANNGLKGSDAGTSLKSMLSGLIPTTDEAQAAMDSLGISADGFASAADPMQYLTEKLTTGLEGMSVAQRNATLETIFGRDGMRAAIALIETGPEAYANLTEEVNKQGVAQDMARAKMDNLNGAMEQLKGSIETVMIVIGSTFIPVMRKLADGINRAMNFILKLPKPIQKMIGIVAAAAAGFLALASGIALAIAFGGPIIAVIAAIAAPILLIVAALAGLYLAWSTNFLGIRDIVTDTFSAIMDVATPFVEFLGSIAHGGGITKETLAGIPEPLRNIAKVLGLVVRGFTDFYNALAGGKGISAALEELWEVIGSDKMLGALSALGSQILGAFTSIDWGAVGSALLSGLETAAGLIGDAATWLLPKLGNLALALGVWLAGQAGLVPWGAILAGAASAAGNITGKIISGLGDLAMGLKTWYDNAINSVDWGNLGFIVGQKVGNLASVLGPKALELVTGFITWLTTHWQQVGIAILALIFAIPATLGYIGATLAPKAAEFLGGFLTGLGLSWSGIAAWFISLPGLAIEALGDLSGQLFASGVLLLYGLMAGILGYWNGTIKPWFKALPALVISTLGSLADTLYDAGLDLLFGLYDGADEALWGDGGVMSLIESIPGAITGKFLGAINWLYTAGTDIVQGLINGVNALLGPLRDIVDEMLGILGKIPGMGKSPWPIMIEAGSDAVKGLIIGMERLTPDLDNVVKGITSMPALAMATQSSTPRQGMIAAGMSNQTIIQNIQVDVRVDELEDMVEAGRFVSQLNGTRTLYRTATAGGNF